MDFIGVSRISPTLFWSSLEFAVYPLTFFYPLLYLAATLHLCASSLFLYFIFYFHVVFWFLKGNIRNNSDMIYKKKNNLYIQGYIIRQL